MQTWESILKTLKKIIYVVSILVAIYLSYKLIIFYIPFLIAFIISMLIEPAIRFIMKKGGLTRKTSSIIIFVIVFLLIATILVWGIGTLFSESTNLLKGINEYFDKAYSLIQKIISKINFDNLSFTEEGIDIIKSTSQDFLEKISNWITRSLTKLLNMLTSLPKIGICFGITIISLYFICVDKIYILDLLEYHMPISWVRKIEDKIKLISISLGGYLNAQIKLILISFIICLIGLYFYKFIGLNVKYPLLIALGIAFVDALPILGSGTIMLPWAIISGLNGDIKLGILIAILWIIMSIIRQFIEPKIVSNKIGIHPIFTLIAMYTGFKFIGVIGLLLGPIALIVLNSVFSNFVDKGIVKTIIEK